MITVTITRAESGDNMAVMAGVQPEKNVWSYLT